MLPCEGHAGCTSAIYHPAVLMYAMAGTRIGGWVDRGCSEYICDEKKTNFPKLRIVSVCVYVRPPTQKSRSASYAA